jgi:predicted aspartyl protease
MENSKVSGKSRVGKTINRKKDERNLLVDFCSEQRPGSGTDGQARKKSRQEKTRAVSESSDSAQEDEQQRWLTKMVAKQIEKAMQGRRKKGSSSDSTPDKSVHFNIDLSDTSDDDGGAAQAKSAFHKVYGTQDGGGSSRAGLLGGSSRPPSLWTPKPATHMKSATIMKDYRIPKIKQPEQHLKTAMEKRALLKNKSSDKASAIRSAVRSCLRKIKFEKGLVDLIDFSDRPVVGKRKEQSKPRAQLEQSDSLKATSLKKSWSENVVIEGRAIKMKVDSGSTVTILTMADFLRLGLSESKLEPTSSRIVTYSGNRITPIGKMKGKVTLRGRSVMAKILVIEEASTSLLGFPEGRDLGLFQIDYGLLARKLEESVNECLSGKDRSEQDELPPALLEIPPCKFSAKLELREGAKPRILAPRRLPIAMREKVKEELDRMTQLGVISPVNEPRDWCHQMVAADKPNGAVRVCLDP